MRKPGRRSAASLAVAAAAAAAAKTVPAAELNHAEREIFDTVVASRPAGFYTSDVVPLLEAYARSVATARYLAAEVSKAQASPDFDFAKLNPLLKAQERTDRAAASIATKLRISPQARYQTSTAGRMAADQAARIDPATGKPRPNPWNWK